jgi:hypothetical protein
VVLLGPGQPPVYLPPSLLPRAHAAWAALMQMEAEVRGVARARARESMIDDTIDAGCPK